VHAFAARVEELVIGGPAGQRLHQLEGDRAVGRLGDAAGREIGLVGGVPVGHGVAQARALVAADRPLADAVHRGELLRRGARVVDDDADVMQTVDGIEFMRPTPLG